MIKLRLSEKIKAIQARIKKLPVLLNGKLSAKQKRNAELFIKLFTSGIRENEFGLKKLHPVTIARKQDAGYSRPTTPLYGAGDSEANSLLNVFAIKKLRNGWQVYPRWAKHHDSDLQLRHLLSIHENGALISVTDRMRKFLHYIGIHLRKDTTIIRIPPRPAQRKAYEKLLKQISSDEPEKDVKRIIKKLIDTGKVEPPTYGLKEI
jgi:hypothetical protein